ncbi:arsenical-resistance protein [Colletotrichum tofieldiae]|nr:arsenical-resistance protein [Colletotrichum tofieldiae]
MSSFSSGVVREPELNKDGAPAEKLAGGGINHDVEQQHNPEADNAQVSSLFKSLGILDRFLAVWIFLAMLIGILLGNFVPNAGPALQQGKFVAVGLLVMMYPILCKVQYEKLHDVFRTREIWIQLGFSVIINWVIAPFFMLALSWAFLPDKEGLRNGLILVGIARCIAMVLIWTSLGRRRLLCHPCGGQLISANRPLRPVALLFIRVIGQDNSISSISYSTVASAVGVFLGIPLGAAILTRLSLIYTIGTKTYNAKVIPFLAPWSLIGLLYTIIVLFASQGSQVVHQIVSVVRVAAPLVVYFSVIFSATLLVARKLGFRYGLACTQAFTAASNNFELAIAIAVAAYGPDSDEALATTVGPLIEVPVLLGLVYFVKWFARRYGWED